MKSIFKTVFNDSKWSDAFYRFLQVVYRLYPEDKFHHLISSVTEEKRTDEEIYKTIQQKLKSIKPLFSDITYALPSLKKQKKEIVRQTLQLIGDRKDLQGYMEIGSTGRYISELKKHIRLSGEIYLTNEVPPNYSLSDIFERGQITILGTYIDIKDYAPISTHDIPDNSLDIVTCYIGLHHCSDELLINYIKSIHRVLRKNGYFIIRDHDVKTEEMGIFVSLVHTVFNLGLNVKWETDTSEFKSFKPIDEWSRIIVNEGFVDSGHRILQDKDPTDNTLICFTKK